MKRFNTDTRTLQRLAIRGAVAALALAALLLGGLLPVRSTHGAGTFALLQSGDTIFLTSASCDPGNLHTAFNATVQPTWQVPLNIDVDDVHQCIATRGPRKPTTYPYVTADMQIENELFKYAVIGTGVGYGTRLDETITATDEAADDEITVVDTTGAATTNGELIIGSEYFSYTGTTATSFTGVMRAQRSSALESHTGGGAATGDFVYATPAASANRLDVETTLNGGIDSSTTTIVVAATTDFAAPGVLQIDSERISYTTVTGTSFTGVVRHVGGIATAASHLNGAVVRAPRVAPFTLEVGDALTDTGFDPLTANHYICIGNEKLQFDPTVAATTGNGLSGTSDTLAIIGRGLPAGGISCGEPSGTPLIAQEAQTPGAGIRDATRIQLLQRAMGATATVKAAHADNAQMSSPQTRTHCLSRWDLGSAKGGGVFNITVQSKCYGQTGASPPPPPPPYDAPTNEDDYHSISVGTFNTVTGVINIVSQVNGVACVVAGPTLNYELRISDVDWNDKNPVGNTAYGKFRINAWLNNPTCANPPAPQFVTGANAEIDSQGVGTNLSLTGLAANADSDAPASPGGDGCSNVDELQTAAGTEDFGGRRDPHNPYDFFDPVPGPSTKRQVLVPDILAVVQKYFKGSMDPLPDGGGLLSPDLKSKYDRTYLGPNVWNLGPPDGLQRVPDILAVVKQYFDSCANA